MSQHVGLDNVDHASRLTVSNVGLGLPVANVFGVLVARSHILRSQPPLFFISLSGHKYPILIVANTLQAMSWITSLNIHHTYTFSNLVRSSKTFHEPHEIVNIFTTTVSSVCMEVDSIPLCINPWVQTNGVLINYQGVVSSSVSPLGLVLLDDKVELCVFFVWSYMDFDGLSQGQEVKIYNAHLTSNKTLVMCCRSSFDLLGEGPRQPQTNLALSQIVGDLKFGFGDYCWLQKQYNVMENKFSDCFLLQDVNISFSIESCEELRINVLAKLLGVPSSSIDSNLKHEELFRDFVSIDHRCILYKQPQNNRSIIKMINEQLMHFNSFCELPTDSPARKKMPYWNWSSHDVLTSNLVGYLNVSKVDGYWHLRDASFAIPCLFDKQLEPDFRNQVVSICQYKVIVETFLPLGKQSCQESKVYLFIPHSAITCLAKTSVTFAPELHASPTPSQTVAACCTLCSIARRHIQYESAYSVCSGEWKTSDMINLDAGRVPLPAYHIHAVVVHYVATPMQLRGVTSCFILVSVLQSSNHHAEAGAFPCILVLDGNLLKVLPLLELGAAFYLHLPVKQDIKTFTRAKLNVQLPWSVVQVPEESLISRHVCTHSGSWWSLRDHASKGLYSVEGVVKTRKELPTKFHSELANIKSPVYGEPNLKTIMIVVQDEEMDHALYLKNWNNRRYPLGLVVGARICATLVKHTTSSNGNEYFQATDLTGVKIMDISDDIKQLSLSKAWSQACDITLASAEKLENTVCGCVQSWVILSVVITAVCGGCKMLRLDGSCESPGCLAQEDSVTFIANARIIINGMGGKKIVYMKDENVREMLDFSPDDWGVLLSFSRKHEMKFRKCHDFTQRQFRSDAENIFQLYCMDQARTERCIYVRCKGFKKNDDVDNTGYSSSFSMKLENIFCIELLNKSPWQDT